MFRKTLFILALLFVLPSAVKAQFAVPIVGGVATAPLVNGPVYQVFLNQSVTSFDFAPKPILTQQTTVIFTQLGGGGFTVAFASDIMSSCTVAGTGTTACIFQYAQPIGSWISAGGGGGGGGGSIGGSIANTQVAFGSGTNTIQGTNNATLDTSGDLTLAGILLAPQIGSLASPATAYLDAMIFTGSPIGIFGSTGSCGSLPSGATGGTFYLDSNNLPAIWNPNAGTCRDPVTWQAAATPGDLVVAGSNPPDVKDSGIAPTNCSTLDAFIFATGTGSPAPLGCDPNLTDNGAQFTFGLPVQVNTDGVHNGLTVLFGETTQAIKQAANTAGFSGPLSSSFTCYNFIIPASYPMTAGVMLAAASAAVPSSTNGCFSSQMSVGLLPVTEINATGTPSSTTFLRGDGTWNTPAGSSVTSAMLSVVPLDGGSTGVGTANEFAVWGLFINNPTAFSFDHLEVDISVADGSDNTDFGLATGSPGGTCTLLAHVGAATYSGTGPQSLALAPNPTTWAAGAVTSGTTQLYFVMTSAATTLTLDSVTSFLVTAPRTLTGSTTGGSLGTPGTTTFTCPANSPQLGNVPMLAFMP